MRQAWRDLSVSKKLYGVVGVMALLIATELFTLLFAMDTLSAVRSFVTGEGFWSKAQKDAVQSLHRYVFTSEEKYYLDFQNHLRVNLGDRQARLSLDKAQPDLENAREGFLQGKNHPQDVPGLIKLIVRFHSISYLNEALIVWNRADALVDDLIKEGQSLHVLMEHKKKDYDKIQDVLFRIDRLNEQMTGLENQFSEVLGAGSRWLERTLMILLLMAVLTIESTGLFLTIRFGRSLSRSLRELNQSAQEVGRGNFDYRAPVHSKDELGQLATALNNMTVDLKNSIGQRREAENANQSKTMFVANMSHEVRSPLGVIMGMAEILKDPNLGAQDRAKYLETITKTGQNMVRIINDVLDVSKVEAGHLQIEKSAFALADFIQETRIMLKVAAERNQNELSFEAEGVLPDLVLTDRTRLRQILVNLIGNALKYTSKGKVRVVYGLERSNLYFRVIDSGLGIKLEDRGRLFQPFSRLAQVGAPREGTGLGLLLSKRLAEALGGDVTLESSEPGQGSTFLLTVRSSPEDLKSLPSPAASLASAKDGAGDKKPETAKALDGKRVLVVEDSYDNQLLLRLFLSRQKMRLDFANNGEEGMEKALKDDYDVILMDMQMPIMDGYAATQNLRKKGYKKPIIALTAHAMKEDRDLCLNAGCDDYLTKPIEPNLLYHTISKYVAGQGLGHA